MAKFVFFFTLLFTFSMLSPAAGLQPPPADEAAELLAFKSSVVSDPAGVLSGWSSSSSSSTYHCSWRGVACDPISSRVTGLNLSSSSLSGDLQLSATITNLRHLEVLNLSNNNFSGQIPPQIATLPRLRLLDLSHNSLSGPIPNLLISSSPMLQSIDFSHNHLSGPIRIRSPCQSLIHLHLSFNLLVDQIPAEISSCSSLKTLLLNDNILEGRIPAKLGRLSGLRVLDVSRNSLTDTIPRELAGCRNLSVLVLTNVAAAVDYSSGDDLGSDEFNAFTGSLPPAILLLPKLEVLWAPRANFDGRLPEKRKGSCELRILNLGQNYVNESVPEWLAGCRNLGFLDLSSNDLQGSLPFGFGARCMDYFNVSRNSLFGSLVGLPSIGCSSKNSIISEQDDELVSTYSAMLIQTVRKSNPFGWELDGEIIALHDFSWNEFAGALPLFSLPSAGNVSYGLLLNNNGFNGFLPEEVFGYCKGLGGLAINLSSNQISGKIDILSSCSQLKRFEAASNRLDGSIPPDIGNLHLLSYLDLSRNYFNGSIPDQLGGLKKLEQLLLGGNSISGSIPVQLGGMASLKVLDLSRNYLTGSIPSSLSNASNLESVFLEHNLLSGMIPPPFSELAKLATLDVSYNNLSGEIPYLGHSDDCKFFVGNLFLQPCIDSNASSPPVLSPVSGDLNWGQRRGKLKNFAIAAVASASVIVCVLVVLVVILVFRRRKLVRIASLRRKVVVTFTDAPAELTYDNVVRATGNFSIQNLIGTGGFGATYKAELVPGFLVAVKRLSIGKFQGLQQFDAEIRTLGRIRHKNLVTLIGYHMGEADTFLIYNYLPGGNLEAFIRDMSRRNVRWPAIHKIALDVSLALSYLHYACVPRIVHRDIKPSNILLDEKLNAYLSDFGLARLLEVSETHATTDVAGTFGYVAPEYATTCRVSNKADVYSFGVVLLELMSGKRSLDPSFSDFGNGFTIVAWGRLLIQEERFTELFAPSLWEEGPKDHLIAMLKLALSCTVESLSIRPTMRQVVETLKRLRS